jgi:hypothetical protein
MLKFFKTFISGFIDEFLAISSCLRPSLWLHHNIEGNKTLLLAIGLTWINCYCSYSYFVAIITIALNAIGFCNKPLNNLYIFRILAFSFLNSEVLSMLGTLFLSWYKISPK